eukprot:COSAG04_NODE_159_length_22103_cov_21.289389_14_plen_32_part_00
MFVWWLDVGAYSDGYGVCVSLGEQPPRCHLP